MSTSPTPPTNQRTPPSEESVRGGHEIRDVNPRVILWLGAGVLIGTAVVQVVLWFTLQAFERSAEQGDSTPSPLAADSPQPPLPHLQEQPREDYQQYCREKEQRLQSYGWVDRQQGVVRIPVSRAMDLIAQRGLPKKKSKPIAPAEKEEQ
jgi:hypothetical protein